MIAKSKELPDLSDKTDTNLPISSVYKPFRPIDPFEDIINKIKMLNSTGNDLFESNPVFSATVKVGPNGDIIDLQQHGGNDVVQGANQEVQQPNVENQEIINDQVVNQNRWGYNLFGNGLNFAHNLWNNHALPIIRGEITDEELISRVKEEAEYLNSSESFAVLGALYYNGDKNLNVERNKTLGIYYYSQAAELGDETSMYILGTIYQSSNITKAIHYFKK